MHTVWSQRLQLIDGGPLVYTAFSRTWLHAVVYYSPPATNPLCWQEPLKNPHAEYNEVCVWSTWLLKCVHTFSPNWCVNVLLWLAGEGQGMKYEKIEMWGAVNKNRAFLIWSFHNNFFKVKIKCFLKVKQPFFLLDIKICWPKSLLSFLSMKWITFTMPYPISFESLVLLRSMFQSIILVIYW